MDCEGCSVTSTAGASIGNTDSDFEPCCSAGSVAQWQPSPGVEEGYASVLLNGIQLICCNLPSLGESCRKVASAVDMNVTGERGGVSVDALLTTTHCAAPGCEWRGLLVCRGQESTETISLGTVYEENATSHFVHYLSSQPCVFELEVFHEVCSKEVNPAEQQLVTKACTILQNPRLNYGCGSLSSVVLNNRIKECELYSRVVGKKYCGNFVDFLRAHPETFSTFTYDEEAISHYNFSPYIKKDDVRVALQMLCFDDIYSADAKKCQKQRCDEEEIKCKLVEVLSARGMSQKELLQRLQPVEAFSQALFPSHALLMRFLQRHAEIFSWDAGADQPTRVGLSASSSTTLSSSNTRHYRFDPYSLAPHLMVAS